MFFKTRTFFFVAASLLRSGSYGIFRSMKQTSVCFSSPRRWPEDRRRAHVHAILAPIDWARSDDAEGGFEDLLLRISNLRCNWITSVSPGLLNLCSKSELNSSENARLSTPNLQSLRSRSHLRGDYCVGAFVILANPFPAVWIRCNLICSVHVQQPPPFACGCGLTMGVA